MVTLALLALVATCHARGPLQDPKCTPGAIDPAVTQENLQRTICRKGGYTAAHRLVTQATKVQVLRAYGLDWPGCGTRCEIDHTISIELGGSNDVTNLRPQMYEPRPGAHEKDLAENFLKAETCAGRITLAEAQREIATDWTVVYRRLTSAQRVKAAKRR